MLTVTSNTVGALSKDLDSIPKERLLWNGGLISIPELVPEPPRHHRRGIPSNPRQNRPLYPGPVEPPSWHLSNLAPITLTQSIKNLTLRKPFVPE